ncbi:MAG: DUF3179 domain-containing (seleno)protein, partial [Dehalococcoidia bacterium]
MRWIIGIAVLGISVLTAAAFVPENPIWRFFNQPPLVERIDSEPVGERGLQMTAGLPRDAIQAITEPEFLSGQEANRQMRDSDRVIGVSVNGDHRAYSVAHLSAHEVVNDTVGGEPVAVTWCPLCFTA